MSISITNNVFNRVKDWMYLNNNDNFVLRVSVDSGGCSGYIYQYNLVSRGEITNDDSIFTQNNILVIIDKISLELMDGSIIDFVNEIDNSYFNVINPNAKFKCGCGNSFNN